MRAKTLARWTVYLPLGAAVLMLLAFLFVWQTTAGARLLMTLATSQLDALEVERVNGSLARGIDLGSLRFANRHVTIEARSASVEPDVSALMAGQVTFDHARVSGLEVRIHPAPAERTTAEHRGVNVPVPIEIRVARIEDAVVHTPWREPVAVDLLDGRFRMHEDRIRIGINELRQEEMAVSGRLELTLSAPLTYEGHVEPLAIGGAVPENLDATVTYEGTTRQVSLSAVLRAPRRFNLQADVNFDGDAHVLVSGEPGELEVDMTFGFDPFAVYASLGGTLLGRNVDGQGGLTLSEDGPSASLVINQAENRIALSLDDARQLRVDATVPALDSIDPALGGSFSIGGHVNVGTRTVDLTAQGDAVAFGDLAARTLSAAVNGSLEELDANLSVTQWTRGETALGNLDVTYDGSIEQGDVTANWHRDQLAARLAGHLTRQAGAVTLAVESSRIETPDDYALTEPIVVRWDQGQLSIDDHCWSGETGTICLSDIGLSPELHTNLQAVDLALPSVTIPRASGEIALGDGSLTARIAIPSLTAAGNVLESVDMTARGRLTDLAFAASALLVQPEADDGAIALEGLFTGDTVEVSRLELDHPLGQLDATAVWRLESSIITFAMEGSLKGRTLDGTGTFEAGGPATLAGEASFDVGDDARLVVNADGDGTLTTTLSASSLHSLLPGASGTLEAKAIATFPDLRWSLDLQGRNLALPGFNADTIVADASGEGAGPVSAKVQLEGTGVAGLALGSGSITAGGTVNDVQLDVAMTGGQLGVMLDSNLGWEDGVLAGTLADARIDADGRVWEIMAPVEFRAGPQAGAIDDHCWRSPGTEACVRHTGYSEDLATFEMALDDAPFPLKDLYRARDVDLEGTFDLLVEGQVRAPFSPANATATARLDAPDVVIRYLDEDAVPWEITGRATLKDGELIADLTGDSPGGDRLRADARIPDITAPADLTAEARLNSALAIATGLIPQLDRADGKLEVDLELNTLGDETLAEVLLLVEEGASVMIPAAGVRLTDVGATVRGNAKRLTLSFTATSGEGKVTGDGFVEAPLTAERSLKLSIDGDDFRAVDRAGLTLTASPDLVFTYEPGGIGRLTGDVVVDDGSITQADFRDGTNRRVSPDVVVVSREEQASLLDQFILDLDVIVQHFYVDLYGLEGDAQGEVSLEQRPGAPRRAVGNVNLIDGTFERYGQSFEVERGRLIFTGQLARPIIDVISVRTIEEADQDVTVSLTLSGPVDNIRSSISATPSMSEAQALSYLMFGRPLQQTSEADEQALSSAALALGLRQAAPVTEEIREALGLESLTVTSRGAQSPRLVAGKQLGKDLYVEYTYDITGEGDGFLFEYKLTDRLSLETRSGEQKSMQLIYTVN